MLGLFEALGETQQTLIGFTEFFKVRSRPFALLQALPYLQDLTGLVNDALGEMVLETVSARIFWFGHVLTTYRGNPDTNAGAMLALLFPRKCAVSHFVVIFSRHFASNFHLFKRGTCQVGPGIDEGFPWIQRFAIGVRMRAFGYRSCSPSHLSAHCHVRSVGRV